MDMSWMAWTKPTVVFFSVIFCLLVVMTLWELKRPGGAPRVGILRFETTRGDRLFISLLTAAYIHIIWLALLGSVSLWYALVISCCVAMAIFKWV